MKPPKKIRMGCIYKITYPNGKVYVGQDRTDDINYFGSAKSAVVAADFTSEESDDMTIRKQILVRLPETTIQELNRHERAAILGLNSNDPSIGYNRTPRWKPGEES